VSDFSPNTGFFQANSKGVYIRSFAKPVPSVHPPEFPGADDTSFHNPIHDPEGQPAYAR